MSHKNKTIFYSKIELLKEIRILEENDFIQEKKRENCILTWLNYNQL